MKLPKDRHQLQLMEEKVSDSWCFEKKAFHHGKEWVAGIDEAGRGPLAGPVVAAAVAASKVLSIPGVGDSKALSSSIRMDLKKKIFAHPDLLVGVGFAWPDEIDEINILQASLLAFSRAAEKLRIPPSFCLLDGPMKSPYLKYPQQTIIKGDARSFLIGAASIVAKETRDAIMKHYHRKWPQYGFLKHKGYPTAFHLSAIQEFGICPIHRKSFDPVRRVLEKPGNETEAFDSGFSLT